MILFASGRTDIPAFYSQWFLNRIKAGFVDVRNPYNNSQVTRYKLSPDVVDAIVFCTKNPSPLIPHLNQLKNFNQYYFVTITPYGKEIEPNVPDKSTVTDSFIELSKSVGKEKICWRYDPIFINSTYTMEYHIKAFEQFCQKLNGFTQRCIISFIDLYPKVKKNFPEAVQVTEEEQKALALQFSRIAGKNGIEVETCAEKTDLSKFGVKPAACVSKELIEGLTNSHLLNTGIQNLRENCLCIPMRDIAYYNCCPHLCRYCYANYDKRTVVSNYKLHDPLSSFLIGGPLPDDIIHIADQKSFKDSQLQLF